MKAVKLIALGAVVAAILVAPAEAVSPNDTHYQNGNQWYLDAINAPEFWDYANGNEAAPLKFGFAGTGIGFLALDDDIDGNVQAEMDFTTSGNTRDEVGSFGLTSRTSGIVGAEGNNGSKLAGLVWTLDIYSAKARSGSTNQAQLNIDYGEAIDWLVAQGVKVLFIDGSTTTAASNWPDVLAGIDDALAAGITVVAPVATGFDVGTWAAHDERIVVVAVTDASNQHVGLTPSHALIDLAAPGQSIYTMTSGGCGCLNWTTQNAASAIVAGVLAGLRSEGVGDWQARNAIQVSATDLGDAGEDNLYGAGLLNARCAAAKVADMNDTDDVDTSDAMVVLSHFGEGNVGDVIYDLDGSGAIDLADAQIVLKFFGASC